MVMKSIFIPTYDHYKYFFFYDVLTNLAMRTLIKELNDNKIQEKVKDVMHFQRVNSVTSQSVFKNFRNELNLDFQDMDHEEIDQLKTVYKKNRRIQRYRSKRKEDFGTDSQHLMANNIITDLFAVGAHFEFKFQRDSGSNEITKLASIRKLNTTKANVLQRLESKKQNLNQQLLEIKEESSSLRIKAHPNTQSLPKVNNETSSMKTSFQSEELVNDS